ncbi:MAG: adenylate/guanylate cyclase domain-containing protein [Flavobacteriaceae bacterium]
MVLTTRACFILGFFFVWGSASIAQDQTKADSLEAVFNSGKFEEKDLLRILKSLASEEPNPDKSLEYSELLLSRAKAMDSSDYVISAMIQKGNALRLKGDLSKSLEIYFEAIKIVERFRRKNDLGLLYISIAAVYAGMENHDNTVENYKKGIEVFKEGKDRKDSINFANATENLGDYYNLQLARPDSALLLFKESGAIFEKLNNKIGRAYNMGNVGLAYAQLGETDRAENNIAQAITMLEELGDYYPIAVYLTYMSEIYADKGDWDAAFGYAQRSLRLARQYGLKEQISDAYLKLSELYEKTGYGGAALKYYKNHIAFRDSVKNLTAVQSMANLQRSRMQAEVDLANQQRRTQTIVSIATAVALFLIFLLAAGLYRRNRFIRRTKEVIQQEKDRSERLLLNILPEDTANELKAHGKVTAKKFEAVTVMFTDFQRFTSYAENLSPEQLVESIGFYFSKFDAIMEKYGLEKIKTIGDAYMCAGGLPFPSKDHALKMVKAAFEILDFVEDAKANGDSEHHRFEIRIGINTGPLVAGVVGSKKFSYDIWGDTVNVASRMESNSEAGKINISESTYELIKDEFDCQFRGEIEAKNRGKIKMYFVKGIKTAVPIKALVN